MKPKGETFQCFYETVYCHFNYELGDWVFFINNFCIYYRHSQITFKYPHSYRSSDQECSACLCAIIFVNLKQSNNCDRSIVRDVMIGCYDFKLYFVLWKLVKLETLLNLPHEGVCFSFEPWLPVHLSCYNCI